jgi:methylthioribose-1-phosphate isomerase
MTMDSADPGTDPIPPTIEWCDDHIRLIDQRRLPHELVMVEARTVDELCEYIRELAVRGAPALGAAGAMGVALAVETGEPVAEAAERIVATRPTAVNLAWGVDRALAADDPAAEAVSIAADDVANNRAMGAAGAEMVAQGANVLTHCNAGSLACVGYGSALGVIRAAHEQGKRPHVWIDETRPLLQGARLTAWELDRLGIACTLVIDAMAASLMSGGQVDLVVVGADRVAANGDTANKVGTHGIAVLAHHFGVPFYVAMPLSTVDPETPGGAEIVVEQRAGDEVGELAGQVVATPGVAIDNRAFDVTPAGLVAGWITEAGVFTDPGELLAARHSMALTRSR